MKKLQTATIAMSATAMLMKRGGTYKYQYLDRQSRLLSSFDIRDVDCVS